MSAAERAIDLYAPLRVSLYWLVGTFVGFLLLGEVHKVDNLVLLVITVSVFTISFALGYWRRAIRYCLAPSRPPLRETLSDHDRRQIKQIVAVSALYYLAYGVVYLREYGMASPKAIANALLNPGAAYLAKFEVYERQAALGSVNTAAQVLTLLGVLAVPLVPFLVVYWRHITGDLRILAAIGLGTYILYFLAIATRSGLGHVLVVAGVAFLVVRAQSGPQSRRRRRRAINSVALVSGLVFVAYMSYTQGNRITEIGGSLEYKYQANPIVEGLTNEEFAIGLSAIAFYPTHGYQGLAHNLETPFLWTHGQGASRAIDSYVAQYGLANSVQNQTYPARTEALTAWPADALWATIYPWLASDLTWYGVPIFMFLLGWWTARWWYEAVVEHNRLALLLLCQAGLLIAFIPANNQIGLSRPHTIAAITLLFLYFVSRSRARHHPRGRSEKKKPANWDDTSMDRFDEAAERRHPASPRSCDSRRM